MLDLNNFLYMDGFLEIVKVHYLDALMATFFGAILDRLRAPFVIPSMS